MPLREHRDLLHWPVWLAAACLLLPIGIGFGAEPTAPTGGIGSAFLPGERSTVDASGSSLAVGRVRLEASDAPIMDETAAWAIQPSALFACHGFGANSASVPHRKATILSVSSEFVQAPMPALDDGAPHSDPDDAFPPPANIGEAAAPLPEQPSEKKWYDKLGLRGYAQFRFNQTTHLAAGSAPAQHAGDSSVGEDQNFLIRRARLILSGDVSDHMSVYLQPDFAVTPPGSTDQIQFAQIRDWYADIFVDTEKIYRFRVGQSKIPYGWENLQSSSNRVPFDRNDAFNSVARNERDLGVFFYWTPVETQELFTLIMDEGLKGSGNYGAFGIGVYNGQGGSLSEENDRLHFAARWTWPFQLTNGQIIEVGMQGLMGDYVVFGAPIRPLGLGVADITPAGTQSTGGGKGIHEERIGWSFIYYPQPIGAQVEWNIGRGPALNAAQTAVIRDSLNGGYAMLLAKLDSDCGTWFPFVRWSYFEGGYRSSRNSPNSYVNEWEFGAEWQIRKELELTVAYAVTDRTNLNAISSSAVVSEASYQQFHGQLLRVQLQVNY